VIKLRLVAALVQKLAEVFEVFGRAERVG
jgi:hypothetical protein